MFSVSRYIKILSNTRNYFYFTFFIKKNCKYSFKNTCPRLLSDCFQKIRDNNENNGFQKYQMKHIPKNNVILKPKIWIKTRRNYNETFIFVSSSFDSYLGVSGRHYSSEYVSFYISLTIRSEVELQEDKIFKGYRLLEGEIRYRHICYQEKHIKKH